MIEIPSDVFNVSGQVHLDTYVLELERVAVDLDRYDDVTVNSLRLSLEAIRKQVDTFSFWQRCCRIGRPAYEERTLLVAFLVQQLLGPTFRETEGMLTMLHSYYRLECVPDHSALSRKLSSKHCIVVLERNSIVATDATVLLGTEAIVERDEACAAWFGGPGQVARGD